MYRLEEQITLLVWEFFLLYVFWSALPPPLCFCMSSFLLKCTVCSQSTPDTMWFGVRLDISDGWKLKVSRFMEFTDTTMKNKCYSDPWQVTFLSTEPISCN